MNFFSLFFVAVLCDMTMNIITTWKNKKMVVYGQSNRVFLLSDILTGIHNWGEKSELKFIFKIGKNRNDFHFYPESITNETSLISISFSSREFTAFPLKYWDSNSGMRQWAEKLFQITIIDDVINSVWEQITSTKQKSISFFWSNRFGSAPFNFYYVKRCWRLSY